MTYLPMTGWGVPGGVLEDTEEPLQVSISDQNVREYVVVPADVLPTGFVLSAVALARHYAANLGIGTPGVSFFAEVRPELKTPWVERIVPELRAAAFFRVSSLYGFAETGTHRIWVDVAQADADLVDTVAHECAHLAGFDERAARAFGKRAARHFGGG